jgi:hypothetical protein
MSRFDGLSLNLDRDDRLSLDDCVLRGFDWFRNRVIPVAHRLCRLPTRGVKVAWTLEVAGDVYFVIDCTAEALRWYRRAARKSRRRTNLERQIAEAQDIIKLQKSHAISPRSSPSGDSRAGLSRMDEEGYSQACEAIALGRPVKQRLANDSRPWVQLLHSRWLATRGRHFEAFSEFHSAIMSAEELSLNAADWFYLPASCWEHVALWDTLHRRRRSITNLGLVNFNRTSQRIGPPELSPLYEKNPTAWNRKTRDLLVRFHLHRTRGDRAALQRLADEFPKWDDVVATVMHYNKRGRVPMKEELLSLDGQHE